MTVEELSKAIGWPQALIRLAVSCGCPTEADGTLSFADLGTWFDGHIEEIRSAAALPPLPEAPAHRRPEEVQMYRQNRTICDYLESRSSDPKTKEGLRQGREAMDAHFLRDA